MGKLRPIGSEKLQGMDKINRMIEIARYKENIPTPINEDKSVEFSKTLADGNQYRIDKEKNGYVIKKSINESEFDYLEPMKNRKYYSSYSQAFKRLNLITKEVNSLVGNDSNISLFNESEDGTRFFLKHPKGLEEQTPAPAPVPAPAPEPAPAPSPEELPAPEPEMPTDEMPSDMDLEPDMEDDEVVTFKTIQKLTGKLAQKLRTLRENPEEPMSSKDIKYVINSVLSALELTNLDEEDKEEIVNKFEGIEGEEGMDLGGEDMSDMGADEMGIDDMGGEEPMAEPSPEMEEEFDMSDAKKMFKGIFSETDDIEGDSHTAPKKTTPTKLKVDGMKENEAAKVEEMIEGLFSESKIDKILKGYFKSSENEKQINENKKQTIEKIKNLSEGIEQEVIARKFFSKNSDAKLLGKTKSKNLVFELNESKFRVTPKGEIL